MPAKDKSKIKCWNCNEFGHFKNKCQAPMDKSVNATTEDHGDALILSLGSRLESWVLDSGASFHSCSDAGIMEHYSPGNLGKVYLADDETLDIVGK